jgi:hypothetical protein
MAKGGKESSKWSGARGLFLSVRNDGRREILCVFPSFQGEEGVKTPDREDSHVHVPVCGGVIWMGLGPEKPSVVFCAIGSENLSSMLVSACGGEVPGMISTVANSWGCLFFLCF